MRASNFRVVPAALVAIFISVGLGACGGSKPDGEGAPGSACTVAGDCGCWDCECNDGVSSTNTSSNGRVCDTSTKTCLDGDDVCAVICGSINQTSVSSTAGTDCAAP